VKRKNFFWNYFNRQCRFAFKIFSLHYKFKLSFHIPCFNGMSKKFSCRRNFLFFVPSRLYLCRSLIFNPSILFHLKIISWLLPSLLFIFHLHSNTREYALSALHIFKKSCIYTVL
jgi:hypothetical protein